MPEMLRASSAKAGHDPRGGLENLLFFSVPPAEGVRGCACHCEQWLRLSAYG